MNKYLFVGSDGRVTTRNTITDEDRASVDLDDLNVFTYSCNSMKFAQLVVNGSYPEDDEGEEDREADMEWGTDQWTELP